jgi:uncharacterized surface protein with fasciclin (FAS1) repeats
MQRLGLLFLLLALVCVVPIVAQETTPEPTPDVSPPPEETLEPVTQADVAPDVEAAESTAEPGGARVPTAHIRIAHLSVDTPPVQIYIDDELSDIQVIAYPDVTGWVELPVGTYSIAAVPIDEDLDAAVIGPLDLSFARNAWVTIAVVGSLENGTLNAQLVAERYGQIPLNQARLTIFHGLEGGPDVDVLANGDTIPVVGLGYTGAFIADVPAGSSNIQLLSSGTQDALLELGEQELEAGTFYFVGLTGTPDAPQAVVAAVQSALVADFLTDVQGTIIETLEADGRFTRLLDAIDTAGLTETLSGEGSFTLFAPVDAAFDAATADLTDDADALRDLLMYHVVEGTLASQDVLAAESLTTLQGSDIAVSVNEQGAFLNGTAQIIIVDIPATNGVIHAINGVLTPATTATGGEEPMEATAEATQEG